MRETVLILTVLLAFAGLRHVILSVAAMLCVPRRDENELTVVTLRAGCDNAEMLLRAALWRSEGRVIALDCGASEETLDIAHMISRSTPRLTVLSCAQFEQFLSSRKT